MKKKTLTNILFACSGLAVVLAVWEIAARAAGADTLVPSPSAVFGAIVDNWAFIWENARATLFIAIVSLILALIAAFVTASLIALSTKANKALSPIVIASQAFPIITIAPFLIAVFGGGNGFIIFFAAYITWFPAVISFIHGLTRVDPDRLALFQTAGATRWQVYRHLRLPSAARYIVAGIRAAAALAFVDAVVAEYGGATVGIGSVIILNTAGVVPQPPEILVGLAVVCAIIGLTITFVAYGLARRVMRPWLVPEN